MREYEVGFIIEPDIGSEGITEQLDSVKGWIDANGGQIKFIDQWGRRRLAYPIEDERDGYYVFIYADLPPEAVSEVERNMRLSEQILRFLVIRRGD